MTLPNVIKLTDEGLFIPHEVFEGLGEVEVVRTPDSIIIQSKNRSRRQVLQVLEETGLLLNHPQAPLPQRGVPPDEQAELARKFSAGRPLSEIVLTEREEPW